MTGLDTNVLIRLLVGDDRKQSAAAREFVEKAVESGETLYLNRIVLAETAWVLARAYGFPRGTVADTIENILLTAEFEVEDSPLAWEALRSYREGSADFADCLIGAVNAGAGCEKTVTFDRRTKGLGTFSLL